MRILSSQLIKETMAELGIGETAYVIENRGRTLRFVNKRAELKTISLEIGLGASEASVIGKIAAAAACPIPEFEDI